MRYGDGWIPLASRPNYEDVTAFLPEFRKLAEAAGRDPATLPVTIFSAPEDLATLRRYRDVGVVRAVVSLPSEHADSVLPILDRWAKLIPQIRE